MFERDEEGMMATDDLNRLLRILKYFGTNSFAFGIKCSSLTTESDGMVFKIKGESYHVFFMKYSYVGDELHTSSFDFDENSIPTNLNVEGFNIPADLDKFIVLNQMNEGKVVSHLCTYLKEDYSKACETGSLQGVDNLYTKIGNDIMQCFDALELSVGGYTLPQITEILTQLQSEARVNQQFEFTQNGKIYRLNVQNKAEAIESPENDADINAGNWSDGSIDMKMRVGFDADGILQFAALGINKNLALATGKTAVLTDISQNMLAKNNALLKEYKVKDIKTTLNSIAANFNSDEFPDGKKVEINKDASFIKILCEVGGIGISFLETAEIEQPVYLASETNTTIKAPPIGTGALEAGAMAVTDITSMVTTVHDLVTDKQARKDAVEGLKSIKDQIADKPSFLFPILGEIVLQELTGSGKEGYKEMIDKEIDAGRKGHLITKTSVRSAVSVFMSGKFLSKLPDMAIVMAEKMPKAKLWLRFRSIDESLSTDLLKKLDNLPDNGNKFLDDFVDATDESLNKFLKQPELLDAWKKMDELGADDVIRRNPGALDAVAKKSKGEKVPEPDTYLNKNLIDNHLKKFENDDIVRITSEKALKDFNGTLGPSDAFVMPYKEYQDMIFETAGDLRKIENKIGFDPNTLKEDVVFAHIKRSDVGEIKIPSGNETGANVAKWIPGGKTCGGISEAIVDLKKIIPFERLPYK
ncbi:MAG TPA: hypothetical protein VHO46_11565 [Bacteroidales bacterium]|nr:hypothetical protein [Bacteroidales bacterium]